MSSTLTHSIYRPIKLVDVELSQPISTLQGLAAYETLWGLVRLYGKPIGYLKLPVVNGGCRADTIASALVDQHSATIVRHLVDAHLRSEPTAPLQLAELTQIKPPHYTGPTPLMTVAVCTRDRVIDLTRCLEAISTLDYSNYEVVVVDNAPSDDATAQLLRERFPQFRYVCEERPGLSFARNKAIAEARGDIIAFTDDDVIVDAGWLRALAQDFAAPAVMAVTGLVVPFELETEAQVLFERCGGFGRGFTRQEYRYTPGPIGKYATYQGSGRFGTGANMAYRRALFTLIGDFDPALGAGTPTRGGEDLEMFFRVLRAGHTLVYNPAAFVRHCHRRDRAALRRQMGNNGMALAAYHGRCALIFPEQRQVFARLHIWWLWAWHIKNLIQSLTRPYSIPRDLILADLAGYLVGLVLYPHARRVTSATPPPSATGAHLNAQA